MVYAVQAAVFFRNASRRNTALNAINTKFSTSPQYGNPEARAITNRANQPGIHVVARFTNASDRDTLWASLDQVLGTGTNGPVVGSRVWIHDCPHDGVGACAISNERTW